MRIGLHVDPRSSYEAHDVSQHLQQHEVVRFDTACDARASFCARLADTPLPPAWAPPAPLAVVTDEPPDVQTTRQLLQRGVTSVLDQGRLGERLGQILCMLDRIAKVTVTLNRLLQQQGLIAASPATRMCFSQAIDYADHSNEAVLIRGESGTGKEGLARLVHQADEKRSGGPFQLVDCTSLSEELAVSELFGHERGAFTGASQRQIGACEAANGGVLFLDEIGELSLPLQAKLLRVVQEKQYRRVGSTQVSRSDFRLLCATHRDLEAAVAQKTFREDLYYRISALCLRAPPLRERREDILPLARHFLRQLLRDAQEPDPVLHPSLLWVLSKHPLPGNVRQLRQIMARAAVRFSGKGPVALEALDPSDWPEPLNSDLKNQLSGCSLQE